MSTTQRKRPTQDPMEKGLPITEEAERWVLGSILRDVRLYGQVAELEPGDFATEKHRRIFRRIHDLHLREERIDHSTVYLELQKNGETEHDTLSYLIDLEHGLPDLPSIDRYVHEVKQTSIRRRIIRAGHALMLGGNDRLQETAPLLLVHRKFLDGLEQRNHRQADDINQVPSAWQSEFEMQCVIEDLIVERAISLISGESGDGKSTFVLAMAGAIAQGMPFLGRNTLQRPVLYLDRENPLFVVKDRLFRLGIPEIKELKIWGTWWDGHFPPDPSAAVIIDYIRKAAVKPVIVFDSLIAFADADENSSNEMRSHMSFYRRLVDLGATVIIIHHRSDKGESDYRGSSDIRAIIDTGFRLSRDDQSTAADALGRLVLKPYKTRIGSMKPIRIEYKDGAFLPVDPPTTVRSQMEILKSIIRAYPRSTQDDLVKQAGKHNLTKQTVFDLLLQGINNGEIEVTKGPHNRRLHSLPEGGLAA